MSKETCVKATLNDFLAKKIKKDENKNRTIDVYVTSMDKTLTLSNPSEEQILDYAEAIGDNTDLKANLEANRYLIYKCCNELQDNELHDALEIKDPLDVPRVLFDMEDVQEIMNQFNELLTHKDINEEIKN
jgi:hypothetical protein